MNLSLPHFEDKSDWLLIIFIFLLIMLPQVSQVAIALYLIHWIATKQYRFIYKIKGNWFAVGSIVYFLFFFISVLYSENTTLWGRDTEAKLPLLVVPVLLTSREKYNNKLVNFLLLSFIGSCITYLGYLGYERWLGNGTIFRNTINLFTFMNSIYAAMYISFALLIGVFFLFKKKKTDNYVKIVLFIIVCILHYSVFAIASRMAILGLVGVELGAVFLWKIWLERQFIWGLGWLLAVFIINFLSLNFAQQAKERMQKISQGDPRVHIWKATSIQIPKSPIIGFGSGDARATMLEGYKAIGFERGLKSKYNNHNQYLESWISAGVFCLITLLGWLVLAFRDGWLEKNYLLCIFIGIIALNILTESMFERQQGTYFMAFWGTVLYWNSRKK